ncbi:universal stress protein [Colwelliaceae bacterium 6441]
MNSFQNILALVQPRSKDLTAIKKSIILAQSSNANLTLLSFNNEMSPYQKWLKKGNVTQSNNTDCIENLMNFAREKKVKINHLVFNGIKQSKALKEQLFENCYDLVMTEHEHEDEKLWPFDANEYSQLLNVSTIPTMFVRNKEWLHEGHVIAAIETEESTLQHQEFNQEIIERTRYIAELLHSDIHLLNCYLESCLLSFDPLEDKEKKSEFILHCEHLAEIAEKNHLNKPSLHIEQGLVDDLIPKQAKEINADIVVLGCGEHKGLLSKIQGHTIDYVLNKLDCDLLSLKPPPLH